MYNYIAINMHINDIIKQNYSHQQEQEDQKAKNEKQI